MIELGHQQVLVRFGPLTLGDVEHGAADARRFWFAVLIDIGEQLSAVQKPTRVAVAANCAELDLVAALWRFGRTENGPADVLAIVGVHQD